MSGCPSALVFNSPAVSLSAKASKAAAQAETAARSRPISGSSACDISMVSVGSDRPSQMSAERTVRDQSSNEARVGQRSGKPAMA